jgi:hypothetical protein
VQRGVTTQNETQPLADIATTGMALAEATRPLKHKPNDGAAHLGGELPRQFYEPAKPTFEGML